MAAKKLFSSSQIAEELDVSANVVRRLIKKTEVEPVEKKGNCAYYDTQAKNAVKKEYKAEEKEKAAKQKAKEKAAAAKKKAATKKKTSKKK